jgi:hypothetical protein
MVAVNVANSQTIDLPGSGGFQLRLNSAEVNGVRKLSVWIKPIRPHSGFAGNGVEIILDCDVISDGIAPGTFEGQSCGRGRDGEKWGLNGGKDRVMVVSSSGDATRIYIDKPGSSIVVRTADLHAAERELGIGQP